MTEPKPLTPLCSAVSDAELEDGMYKGLDVKEYCDMLPDCYVTESEEGWACESAMDICRAIEGEEECAANEMCEFTGTACIDPTTWGPLDVAVNWMTAVNTGAEACEDVAGLFQANENPKMAPPILLGTVGAPYSNPQAGYDIGREEVAVYFCQGFLPSRPAAFVCGVTKFDGVCEGPLSENDGPLQRGTSHYSVLLDQEFDQGRVALGNQVLGLPYSGAVISGNWGFLYNEGEKAGMEYIARFTFVLDQNGYIQTLHSDFVPGTKTPYDVPTGK